MFHRHGGDIYAWQTKRRPNAADGQLNGQADGQTDGQTDGKYSELKDFSANINFRGMPDAVRTAAERAVSESVHYPDPECRALRTALARRENALLQRQGEAPEAGRTSPDSCEEIPSDLKTWQIRPKHIICGNGAAELIFALAAARRPRRALLAVPSFFEYEQALAAFGCEIRHFELREEQDFRLGEDFLKAIDGKTDCVVLGNPNNPTGRLIEGTVLERIVARCREQGILLVLDESFYDFLCDEDKVRTFSVSGVIFRCAGHPGDAESVDESNHADDINSTDESNYADDINSTDKSNYADDTDSADESDPAGGSNAPEIFVIKSFTKIYGMPGLRFGYGLCRDTGLLERMREVLQPWNVSLPAQAAAEQAARELLFARESARQNNENRAWMARGIEAAGYRVFLSEANFLLFRGPEDLKEYCLERGFLIRDCSNFPGLGRGYFRICVRGREENEALLRVLAEATSG